MNKKERFVLVTGVAGFIGFHLVKRLLEKGFFVVGLDNLNDYYDINLKLNRLKELGIKKVVKGEIDEENKNQEGNFHFVHAELEDLKFWKSLAEKYEVFSVIHMAAQAGVRFSLEEPQKYVSSNINGFVNVLEFCRIKKIQHLIYASSSSVYGMTSEQPFSEEERCDKPVSLYAATKRANEMMAYTYFHLFGINSIGLRFFTVYGPWGRPDMAPMLFAKAAFEELPIKVFNHGNQSRDFTYIDDIINGIEQVFQKREEIIKGADICNIGNGRPIKLMDFISAIEKNTNRKLLKEFVEAQPGDVEVTFADTSKLKQVVSYRPRINIEEGVRDFIKWYKEYYKV